MALVADIAGTWASPTKGIRAHLARPPSEAFIFTFLFVFLLLTFVGLAPLVAREAFLQPEVPLTQRLVAAALALCATIPFWYLLAAVSQLVAGIMGGQGDFYRARLALFWALACAGPLMLLRGMVQGFIGPGPQANAVGIAIAVAFLWLWLRMLREAQRP
jgi:hypothetical protein